MSAPSNPFSKVQERIRTLIAAAPYFAGLRAGQLLTEQPGDIAFMTEQYLQTLEFGVMIETPKGEAAASSYEVLKTGEEVALTIIHRPQTDPAHSAIDALWAIIGALQGVCVYATEPTGANAKDYFAFVGHHKVGSPVDQHIHEVRFGFELRLLPASALNA